MALRAGSSGHEKRNFIVKRPYWIVAGLLVLIVITVLFVPGLSDAIEARILGWLAQVAS